MAPKKTQPKLPSPSSSSSSGSSSDEEGHETRSIPAAATTNPTYAAKVPPPKPPSSSEEDDSEGSSSEYDSDAPISSQKPTVAKPVSKAPPLSESEETDDDDDTSLPPPRRPTSPPTSKPAETPAKPKNPPASEKKRKAPETPAGGTPSGKKLFQRVWTEDDEIILLKGLAEFQEKHGHEPSAPGEYDALHDLLKKSFHAEFSRAQLVDKIRKLKKKYSTNLSRGKKGSERVFAKAHEQASFDISKKIWGDLKKAEVDGVEDGNNAGEEDGGGKKSARKAKAAPRKARNAAAAATIVNATTVSTLEDRPVKDGSSYVTLSQVVDQLDSVVSSRLVHLSLKSALFTLNPEKLKDLEKKWSNQCADELRVFRSRISLVNELVGVLDEELQNRGS